MPELTTSHGGELDEDWYPELEELPQRPRRKLITPTTVALAVVLFAACGFIGGVLVQKGQASGTPATGGASGVASRFAAAAAGASGASGTAGFASRFGGLFPGAGGGASGTVSSISGSTLYVTETSGNTVAVVTTPESKITKSESVKSSAIHPGDSIVVEGITGSSGTITASSVTDSGNSGTSSSSTTSSSGVSSLFGSR